MLQRLGARKEVLDVTKKLCTRSRTKLYNEVKKIRGCSRQRRAGMDPFSWCLSLGRSASPGGHSQSWCISVQIVVP